MVFFGVLLRCVIGFFACLACVAVSSLRMVGSLLVVAFCGMFGCGTVMFCGLFVVLCSFFVMLLWHKNRFFN